jgi:hypothetical protein
MPTVKDVLDQVRDILQDVDAERYGDPSLLRILNVWIMEMRRARPDAFVGTFHTPAPTISALADELPFPEQFFLPTVHFVAGTAEMRDDQFTQDGRANTLIGLARSEAGIR